MKQKFCQSCGMPLTDDVLGTNGRSSESHPSLLEDGRVVTDEGEANASQNAEGKSVNVSQGTAVIDMPAESFVTILF